MCPLGPAWTHQGHVRLWCRVRLGTGHRLSSCGGCGCDRCFSDVCLALVPFVGHVPGVRVEVGVDGSEGVFTFGVDS